MMICLHTRLLLLRPVGTWFHAQSLISSFSGRLECTNDCPTVDQAFSTYSLGPLEGKTGTVVEILFENNFSFSSFVGGISENYNSNYINNGKEMILVEADEFDRSFLKLSPDIACVTSIDFDHSDIYKNRTELLNSFKKFSNQLKKNGIIVDQNKHYG